MIIRVHTPQIMKRNYKILIIRMMILLLIINIINHNKIDIRNHKKVYIGNIAPIRTKILTIKIVSYHKLKLKINKILI
jgi:hypothetical protein